MGSNSFYCILARRIRCRHGLSFVPCLPLPLFSEHEIAMFPVLDPRDEKKNPTYLKGKFTQKCTDPRAISYIYKLLCKDEHRERSLEKR